MNILTLDFETHFSDDYTLKKMTTESYVRDPRFEMLLCGVRMECDPITGEGPAFYQWADAENLHYIFDTVDWANTAVLCHHSHFDGLILSHHYGVKPRAWLDTLSMARLLIGNHLSVSLESLARHFNLEPKFVPYEKFRGKRWADCDAALRSELGAGCLHDVSLTFEIFQKLMRGERAAYMRGEL